MHNDRLLYKLVISTVALLLVVAVSLPAVMQDTTPTPTANDTFELTGTLQSINLQEIVIDGITVDIRIADLGTRLTLGEIVRVEGTLEGGTFTAREVGPPRLPDPAATPEVTAGEASGASNNRDDDDFEFRGIIDSVGEGFVIVSGQRVEIASSTEIEAPLTAGQLVKVEGRLEGGIFAAREIETPDDDGFFDSDRNDRDDDNLNIPADCVVNAPAGWVSYTIRPGETISSIAARSGSRVSELVRANCLDDPRFIVAGSSLLLPRIPTSFPGGGNESSGSSSRSFPNDSGGGNESSGSSSRSFPNNPGGGNESSGSSSHSSNESSGSSSGSSS